MDNSQLRNVKPMGVSFTVSLSLHLVVLLIMSALWGTGSSRPSLNEALVVGLVAPAGDDWGKDKTLPKTENTTIGTEKVVVPDIVAIEMKAEQSEEGSLTETMKEREPWEEKTREQETEENIFFEENELVPQAIGHPVVEESDPDAVPVEPGEGEINEISAVAPSVVGKNGAGKARTEHMAEVNIEVAGSVDESAGPGVDAKIFAIIKQRITAAVSYPYLARIRGMEGTVLVEFSITDDGKPTHIDVKRSSGHRLLDREAEKTIKRASPYPSLKEKIEIPVTFRLIEHRNR